ncbi:hypothetical protein KA037_01515 [Patescibacteria group bacterium]|nr:hypothetical protein [Patescibacteria group bacterium]MBP7841341.1 hypothetical protein [Patescibacteria group bacterium]
MDVNKSFLHQIDFTTLTKTPNSASNVFAGDSAKVSTKTDTVPVATNKFGEEVFDKYVDDIQNRYTLDFIKKIVKNNPIAVSFVDRITELSFTDANPNLTIEYMEENQ